MQTGHDIRDFRLRRNLTQAAVGQLVGRSAQTVGLWERNETDPDPAALVALRLLDQMPTDRLAATYRDTVTEPTPEAGELAAWLAQASELHPTVRERTDSEGRERVDVVPGAMRAQFKVEALRTMTTGSTSALVPGELRPEVDAPLWEEQGVLWRLGARMVQLDGPWPGAIARSVTDPGVQWLAEDDESSPSALATFGNYTLSRKTAAVGPVRISRRLRKQSRGLELAMQGVRRAFLQAFTEAALDGDGTNEPLGLFNTPDVSVTDKSGSLALDDLWDAIEALEGDPKRQAPRLGWLASPDVKRALVETVHGDDYAWTHDPASRTGQRLVGVPAAVSALVPEKTLVLADWSQLEFFHDGLFDVSANTVASDATEVFCFVDCACRVVHPSAFRVLQNVLA